MSMIAQSFCCLKVFTLIINVFDYLPVFAYHVLCFMFYVRKEVHG